MTKEDIEFLRDLQHELNTQSNSFVCPKCGAPLNIEIKEEE